MKNKITFVGANIVLFTFAILFLIFQFVLAALVIVYGENYINDNMYYILLVNQYVLILVPVLAYAFIKKLDFKEVFRLNNPGVLPVLIIILTSVPAYFVAVMLNTLVVYLIQFIGEVPTQPIPVPQTPSDLIIGILVVAVSPAICEELLHRGILLKAYEKRGTTKALIITSIIFGIFHFDIVNLLGPIFLGLLIGYYVVRTNSIFAGIIAHFLNNAIAEILQYITRRVPSNTSITVSSEELLTSVFYGIIGLIVVGLLMMAFKRVTTGRYTFKPSISTVKDDVISVLSHWPIAAVLAMYLFVIGIYMFSIAASKFSGL